MPSAEDLRLADLRDPRLWAAVGLTGAAAGGCAIALVALLHAAGHLAYPGPGSFLTTVRRASAVRRVVVLLVAGAVAGAGWSVLRAHTRSAEVEASVHAGQADVPLPRSLGTSVLVTVTVGLGSSLGREAAPRQMGAACASLLGRWLGLAHRHRRLLIACGSGAGMAAVYDVPVGGALLAAEVAMGTLALPVLLPALGAAAVATAVALLALPSRPLYPVPGVHPTLGQALWALLAGPVLGLAAVLLTRLLRGAAVRAPAGPGLLAGPVVGFGLVGLLGTVRPEVFGNGQDLTTLAIAAGGVGALAALVALKPLATALCLGSGANGGLFTPTLASGAALGAVLGHLWSMADHGTPAGAYAVVGATAVLAAAMRAPAAALVLMAELTRGSSTLWLPMVLATAGAVGVSRLVPSPSIYSLRAGAQAYEGPAG